jgi:hypothetical protein
MARLQTINVDDSLKLSRAMKSGKPFYIFNGAEKVIAYDPEREVGEQKLIALLEEADNCKERCTLEECAKYIKSI